MIDTVQLQVFILAVSTSGIRRFNTFKKKKLMLDNIEPQFVGKMFYKLFRGNK